MQYGFGTGSGLSSGSLRLRRKAKWTRTRTRTNTSNDPGSGSGSGSGCLLWIAFKKSVVVLVFKCACASMYTICALCKYLYRVLYRYGLSFRNDTQIVWHKLHVYADASAHLWALSGLSLWRSVLAVLWSSVRCVRRSSSPNFVRALNPHQLICFRKSISWKISLVLVFSYLPLRVCFGDQYEI